MIVYFSATGNSQFVAKAIAENTQDKALSMENFSGDITLENGENLGIVLPVYFWGLPSIVQEFFDRVKINNAHNSYIYLVATNGGAPGGVEYFVGEILKKQGYLLSASYSVQTVDTWTVWYDANNKEQIKTTLDCEKEATVKIIESVKNKQRVFISKGKKSIFMSKKARYFYEKARKTRRFKLLDSCISCGLCEQNCPIKAIKIIDNKPTFIKDKCAICFRCLHNCPTFSIQYGKKTQKHGQYVHP